MISIENNKFYRISGYSPSPMKGELIGVSNIKGYYELDSDYKDPHNSKTFWFDSDLTYLVLLLEKNIIPKENINNRSWCKLYLVNENITTFIYMNELETNIIETL